MFNEQVINEIRPTVLLVYSSEAKDCKDCESARKDFQVAAEQVKGHVRFGAVNVRDPKWPLAESFLKSKTGLDADQYPYPIVVMFGSAVIDEKGQAGRPGRLYNGPRTVDGFRQLAAQSLPDVPFVHNHADLDALLAEKENLVVLFSNKGKASPFVRSLAYALSGTTMYALKGTAKLVLCDVGGEADEAKRDLARSLNLSLPLEQPTMVVFPAKAGMYPGHVPATSSVLDELILGVAKVLVPRSQPKPKSKPPTPPPTPPPQPPSAPWLLTDANQAKIDRILKVKAAVVLAYRLSGSEKTPEGWNKSWAELNRAGQSGFIMHCSEVSSKDVLGCQNSDKQTTPWIFQVYPHARSPGSAPYTFTSLDAAVKKARGSLSGQVAEMPKDMRQNYFSIIARDWVDPNKGRIAIIVFGSFGSDVNLDGLFALAQALPDYFLVTSFPDATTSDLEDLGITGQELPLVAAFLPVLEDPPPPKGYQFKVAFYSVDGGFHFDTLVAFGMGLLEVCFLSL